VFARIFFGPFWFVFAWSLSTPAYAGAQIVTVAFEEWPPYEFTIGNAVNGIDVEIIREVGRRLNVKFEFKSLPWKRALRWAQDGTVDAIFSISRNDERSAFLFFPETPLNFERKVLFSLKSSSIRVKSFSELRGMKVGVVPGNFYGKDFDESVDFEKVRAPNQELLFKMLMGKRFDALATNDLVGIYIARTMGIGSQVEVQPLVVAEMPLYIAFSKAKGNQAEGLTRQVSDVLKAMKAEGFLDRAYRAHSR
jgi:polar amino acid transport system substrate-binding protein